MMITKNNFGTPLLTFSRSHLVSKTVRLSKLAGRNSKQINNQKSLHFKQTLAQKLRKSYIIQLDQSLRTETQGLLNRFCTSLFVNLTTKTPTKYKQLEMRKKTQRQTILSLSQTLS